MAQLTILHNPKCSTSKHAMDEISAAGADAEVVQYLKTPLDRAELLALMAKLEDPPADLVRKDGFFKDLGLAADDWASSSAAATPEAVADLLVEHPRLMQRPVLVRGDRAIIGRPKDRVPAFLAG